jgi:LmbE family N-acetylglucosaminyl deacetylase
MENWYIPYQTAALPAAQKVWVLAPHPDDEVFGCGGAAMQYAAQGAQVHITVVSGGTGYAQQEEAASILATREAETNAALQALGLAPAEFWRMPDRGLAQSTHLAQRLLDHLQTNECDVVFAPSLHEVHPDHLAVTRALLQALEMRKAQGQLLPYLVQYEIGAPLQPNLLLDISKVWPQKQKAMQCFASQLTTQNYAKHIEALNTYRTYSLPVGITHAEAFCVLKPEDALQADSETRWFQSVMSAAEAGAEALQRQVVTQNLQIENIHKQWEVDRSDLLKQWQAESKAMREHADALLKRTEVLTEELQRVSIENERKRIEIERLVAANAQDKSAADAFNAHMQQALAEERSFREALQNSLLWKLTKPLRWLRQRIS